MSSKNDLYDHLKNHLQVSLYKIVTNSLQYYMPPLQMFTKDFAKEIFCGNKKLLKLKDAKFVNIIRYDELSVKGLYGKFMTLDGMP